MVATETKERRERKAWTDFQGQPALNAVRRETRVRTDSPVRTDLPEARRPRETAEPTVLTDQLVTKERRENAVAMDKQAQWDHPVLTETVERKEIKEPAQLEPRVTRDCVVSRERRVLPEKTDVLVTAFPDKKERGE